MSCSAPLGFRSLSLPSSQLCLAAVLRCGQSFRWQALPIHSGSPSPAFEYRLCLSDRVVCLRQSSDALYYRSVFHSTQANLTGSPESSDLHEKREAETLSFLQDYFQLDIDLPKLYDDWSAKDAVFGKFRDRFEGIRMLRQDPWENLVSFICSANNNISRITKMVQSLCTQYSAPLVKLASPLSSDSSTDEAVHDYHPFPPPSALAKPSVSTELRKLGFGYRAEYVHRTAEMLIEEHGSDEEAQRWLVSLRQLNTADARAELLKFMGVGRKVADCVLLMSMDKAEVVPVDTHVHQIAIKYYNMKGSIGSKVPMTPKLYGILTERFVGIWGEYAGWAHSVMFTADLRSFSSYGMPTPSPTPTVTPERHGNKVSRKPSTLSLGAIDVPLNTPSSTLKRKRMAKSSTVTHVTEEVSESIPSAENNVHDSLRNTATVVGGRSSRKHRRVG